MADNIESRIDLNIDVSSALASIKTLQAQISAFHQSIRNSGNSVNQAVSDQLTRNLLNSINATKQFSASLTTVKDSSQAFTSALEKNKLSLGEYFKFGVASTQNFGRIFKNEFNTIEKVARERVKTLQTQYIRMGRDANGALEAIKVRPLRLDMEQLGTQVAMTAQKQQLFNQLLKQGTTNLLNFGKNTQWAGRQLMVGFTIPLSIMATTAIKEFEKIEKQAIRFRRVYGDTFSTTEETEAALRNMRELATEFTKYGIEVNKTLQLAADAAQMGLTGAELRAQVTEATRLAVLGEVEQQQALEATISVTNAFGIAAEDLAKKIDFLNAVENQTVTSIQDLTVAIPKAGPVIQQLGGNVEDLAFFLTAMREGGINASEGANALKSGLSKIINPTEKASKMLAGFGINLNGIVEANKGDIKGTVLALATAFDTLDPLNRARAIEQLFGTFQFARLSTLFQNVTKEAGQAQRVLELSNASAQQLAILSERELKKVEESPLFKLQKAIERLQESLAPLGVEFMKIITPLIEFGTGVLKKFNEMDAGAKSFVTNVVTVLGLIAPVAIMTFGLLANGIANFIKGINFVRGLFGKLAGAGTGLNQMTQYMTMEQLEATAAASALGQAHSQLTTIFTSESAALSNLTAAYNNAIAAINRYNAASAQTRARPGSQAQGYASGILSVPGPKGAGDIIPAMLSPGEAVIPAEEAQKYRGMISAIISDSVPGFSKGVFLGMPKSAKGMVKNREAANAIYQNFLKSKYANVAPTEYGHQLAKSAGHSFPIFGLGGVYMSPAGKKVFVKPVIDETAAIAEMRGTEIARKAHGLKAPRQRIVVIRDPLDVKRQRRFLALESDLDPTFMNNDEKAVFNEEQYFRQLVASLVRVDKDLSASNVFGDVVADVGPAGVFSRASGQRDYADVLPSMEEQAMINLIGVRGGAKRAFAEATKGLLANLTPSQYRQKMVGEIQRVLPLLRKTVNDFGLTDPREVKIYTDMIKRLEEGLGVDWAKFHAVHSALKVKASPNQKVPGFKDGVFNLGGPRGAGDIIPAMIAPGESVISADMTKKYAPIVKGIISDSIPGFQNQLDGTSNLTNIMDYVDPRRRPARQSVDIIDTAGASGMGLARELADAGVSAKNAMKILSEAADKAKTSLEDFEAYVGIVRNKIEEAPRTKAGEVKSSEQLVKDIRTESGFDPNNRGSVLMHVSEGGRVPAQKLLERAESNQLKVAPGEMDALREKAAAGESLDVKSGLGIVVPPEFQKVNAELNNGGASIEEFSQAIQSTGIEKWNDSIKFGGGNIEELSAQTQILENEFQRLVAAVPAGTKVFDTTAQATAAGENATSLEQIYGQARTNVKGQAPDLIDVLDTAAATPTEIRGLSAGTSTGRSKRKALGAPMPELQDAAITKGIAGPVEQSIDESIDSAIQSGKRELEIKSPSERSARELGLPISQGIAKGIRDGKPEIDDARDYAINFNAGTGSGPLPPPLPSSSKPALGQPPKLGAPPIPGFEQANLPSYSTVPPAQRPGLGGIKDVIAGKGKQIFEKGVAGLEKSFMTGALGEFGPLKNLKETIIANAEMDARIAGASNVELTDVQGNVIASIDTQNKTRKQLLEEEREILRTSQAQIDQEEALLRQQQTVVAEEGQNLDQQQAITNQPTTRRQARELERREAADNRKLRKQAAAQKRSARSGRAFGVLSTASMVAGLASGVEGPVGQIAQQALPILGTLSAIAPILLALPAPLALLAAGVGIAAFAFMKWNEMIDNARKEGTQLANALTMTTDKLVKLSEATGKVSATEERRRKEEDQLSGEEGKARKFGQTFLESEAGKGFLADIATVTNIGGSKAEAAGAAASQLGMMIAQGLISSGEASSIAAAIGTELNDYNFSADITGNLIGLIGPNGEDLTKDPLRVMIAIQEQSMQNLQDISTMALDSSAIAAKAEEDLIKERNEGIEKAATEKRARDVRFERGGGEGFVAGLEGWAADAFGFKPLVDILTGNANKAGKPIEDIAETDPELFLRTQQEGAKLQAASVQLGINQVQQNQQLLDSLEKQYESKIKQKESEIAATTSVTKKKKLEEELNQLYKDRDRDINSLNAANAKALDQIVSMRDSFDPKVFGDAIKTSVLSQFAEDNPLRVLAEDAVNRLNALEDSEFKTQIQLQFASGELSVDAVNRLLEAEKVNPQIKATFDAVVDKRGVAASGQLLDLMAKAGLSGQGVNQYLNVFAQIQTDEEFDNTTEALAQIANMNKEYGFRVNLETADNKNTLKDVTSMVAITNKLKGKKLTQEYVMEVNRELNDPNLEGIINNWDTLFGEGMVGSAEVFVEFTATGDYASVNRYLDSLGLDAFGKSQYFKSMASDEDFAKDIRDKAAAYDVAQGRKNNPLTSGNGGDGGDGGGAAKENPLDALLRRLKLVRDASVNAAGGLKTLRDVMKSGTKATSQFLGIEQKLLDQGVSKRFIDELMSMDEEFRNLYLKGEKSGVVQLTKDGERLQQLLNELSLGDYNISISANLQEVNAQITAMTKLTQQGVSVSEASEIVQDKTLALAIAFDTTGREVTRLVDELKKLKEAEKKLMLSTPEGRIKEFQSVAAEANAYFAAQEEQLNLQYEAGVKAYEIQNGIIEAQRQVADMEFNLDDLQYALDQIAQQEEKINEEYDKREEAIENIFKANKAIIDQDKEKLDIAGALASGDLAAAAKAMRAQTVANLERNKELQLDNLQRSRELELSQIRSKGGQSRLELEKQIRDVEKQIAEIQESKLEPYQREVDLLDRIRQDALKDVQENGFLGQTQARWNQIANEVERAKFGVTGYMDELKNRLAAIPGIKFNADGTISLDAAQLQTPAVNPAPTGQTNETQTGGVTTTTTTTATEMSEKDKQIAELNRRIAITRWRVQNAKTEKLTTAQINDLKQLNMKRMAEIKRLDPNATITAESINPKDSNTAITKLGPGFATGGMVAKYMRMGGLIPYKAEGGSIFKSLGSDTVPAMLTPGEFVVRRQAVRNFGVDRLSAINNGAYSGDSVYNYEVNVNVKSDANPDEIARSVMAQIKRVESQRLRSNRF